MLLLLWSSPERGLDRRNLLRLCVPRAVGSPACLTLLPALLRRMSVGRRLQMNARGGKGTRLSFGPQVKAGDMVTVEVDALKKAVRFYRNQARGWSFFHACSLSPLRNLAPGTQEGDHVSTPALCRWLYVRHIRCCFGSTMLRGNLTRSRQILSLRVERHKKFRRRRETNKRMASFTTAR